MRDRSTLSSINIHLYEYFQDMHKISCSSDFGAPYGDLEKKIVDFFSAPMDRSMVLSMDIPIYEEFQDTHKNSCSNGLRPHLGI